LEYFLSIFLGTFLLEDLALASSLVFVSEGKLSLFTAFMACFLGISIGDLGLYFIGRAASYFGIEKHFSFFKKYRGQLYQLKNSSFLSYSIVISRVIPGTRLPTYVGAGYLKYPFFKFLILTLASVFVWVLVALLAGATLSYIFMNHWFLGIITFLVLLNILKTYGPKLVNKWERKALRYSWRQWLSFEFWPAWFFYLPLVPYYIFLSIKYRSLFMPFYVYPELKNGGLIGESKWDFLKHFQNNEPSTLKSLKISQEAEFMEVQELLKKEGFDYPFIIKPDVGQRGFGVRIIRNDFDLTEYLLLSQFERIVQKLSHLPNEAGIFYIRQPTHSTGTIFSITDKKFPFVVGDGSTQLGQLILNDKRARIIASLYFSRLQAQLDSTPEKGEVIRLAECGNHCQGSIFLNGASLVTPELTTEIDRITKQMPNFYFGRLDVRYKDSESLRQGQDIEIVEVNGAGAEATHIWDAKTTLFEAYKTLYKQWALLFLIGSQVRLSNLHRPKVNMFSFLKDCAKVFWRKESLSISS
jgi:membrane protein DedA with SNARE-associated domain